MYANHKQLFFCEIWQHCITDKAMFGCGNIGCGWQFQVKSVFGWIKILIKAVSHVVFEVYFLHTLLISQIILVLHANHDYFTKL